MRHPSDDGIAQAIAARAQAYCSLSDSIWDRPEPGFHETFAAEEHRARLIAEGFRVTAGVAGMPTALVAETGEAGPVIAFLGEYDALPGFSQRAGVDRREALVSGGDGHGCGHNLLGTGSLLAAAALAEWSRRAGVPLRVRYYGCPAEENGSGKGFLVRAGLFDGVDAAFCWHPAPVAAVNTPVSLACCEMIFAFDGKAAHAAAAPHLGRSALDAVELMNVGVNYLREHMPPGTRIHYAITDSGGSAPNVVQAHAEVRYMIRAPELDGLTNLVARAVKVAQGAALMTESTMAHRTVTGEANLLGNPVLETLMQEVLEQIGLPDWDAEDLAFARAIRATLGREEIDAALTRFGLATAAPLADRIPALHAGDTSQTGSTDVGTVSWVVPTVQMRGATHAIGTPLHSWQLVAQGKSALAHKGMLHVARVMAETARRLALDPGMLAAAQAAFQRQRGNRVFVNPLPQDAEPAL